MVESARSSSSFETTAAALSSPVGRGTTGPRGAHAIQVHQRKPEVSNKRQSALAKQARSTTSLLFTRWLATLKQKEHRNLQEANCRVCSEQSPSLPCLTTRASSKILDPDPRTCRSPMVCKDKNSRRRSEPCTCMLLACAHGPKP